jgi:23S rRNA (uridine2552-2'-O)-methyltransferase
MQTLLKKNFRKVANVKPPASRSDSSEKFVVAQGFRGASLAEAVEEE